MIRYAHLVRAKEYIKESDERMEFLMKKIESKENLSERTLLGYLSEALEIKSKLLDIKEALLEAKSVNG